MTRLGAFMLGIALGAIGGTSAFALWAESRDRVGVTVE